MPNLWLRWLQLKPFASSSSATPTHSHIARLILDQKSASEALRTFRWASDLPDYRHSQSTYSALIHKLCTFRRFDTVKEVLEEMPQRLGAPPDDDTFVTLVRGLARAGMLRRVLKVPNMVVKFRGGTAPSLKILNSVLNVLVKENIDVARDFFRNHMMVSGVGGDDCTFGILMKGLCSTNRIADAFKLLQLIKSRGTIPNTVIYNTLLHALCRNGSVGRARSLLSEIDEPSDVTFNILVSAYCGEGNLIQALVLLDKCLNLGLLPDIITVTKVLELLCQSERVSEAVEILERVESKGVSLDVQAYNTVIKGFCRLGKPKVGRRILKEMEKKGCLPNADSYNVLISGFCNAGMCESAVDLFEEMKTDGIEWSFETYNALITGLCSIGRTRDGLRILQLMEESRDGFRGQISPYNSVLYGLYRENRIEEGLEFLKNMEALFPEVVHKSFEILELCKERKNKDAKSVYDEMSGNDIAPSAFVYSRLITGLCGDGCLREALELTNEMISRGFTPIASTLNSVIEGFCQHGRADTGIRFIEDMAARGCMFDSQSYGLLLHWFCEDGRSVEKARKMLSEMVDKSIIPDYSSWNSMLLCLSQQTEWSVTSNDLDDLVNITETCQDILSSSS